MTDVPDNKPDNPRASADNPCNLWRAHRETAARGVRQWRVVRTVRGRTVYATNNKGTVKFSNESSAASAASRKNKYEVAYWRQRAITQKMTNGG